MVTLYTVVIVGVAVTVASVGLLTVPPLQKYPVIVPLVLVPEDASVTVVPAHMV